MKKLILIIAAIIYTININQIIHADELRGNYAFMGFKINPSQNISYSIDNKNTKKYKYNTDAWKNAVNKFSNVADTDIVFNKSNDYNVAQIQMTSTSSSKEEWVGLSRYRYYNGYDGELGSLISAENTLNNYTINEFDLSKNHIYQVALHELGHSFGLTHQPQEYYEQTIMTPYIYTDIKASIDLKSLDKENLIYGYIKEINDWKEHWAREEIQFAMDNGWVDKSNKFRPRDSMTRAEFVKVFNRVFKLYSSSGIVFEDTINHWAQYEIDIAVTNGVCQGISSTKFNPNGYITREEVAKMLGNYMNIKDSEHDKLQNYIDYSLVSDWVRDELEAVIEKGYIYGTPEGYLNPKNTMTRAEVVSMLSRVK